LTSHLCKLIVAITLTASTSLAGYEGWPVPTNASWYAIQASNYVGQIYSSAYERVEVNDPSFNETTDIVETWTVPDHAETNIATNAFFPPGGGFFLVTNANVVYLNMEVTTTNVFGDFEYTNTIGGTNTSTAYVTENTMFQIDRKIFSLFSVDRSSSLSGFIVEPILTNGTIQEWFNTSSGTRTNARGETIDIYPNYIPTADKENAFYYSDIAYDGVAPTNVLDDWGYVTNDTGAYSTFKYQPSFEWNLPQSEISFTGGAWDENLNISLPVGLTTVEKLELNTNSFPIIRYRIAGTNVTSPNVTVHMQYDDVGPIENETITLTSTNDFQLTNQWTEMTLMEVTAGSALNTNDTISVVYTNNYSTHAKGESSHYQYRLYADTLNERKQVLDTLIRTYTTGKSISGDNTNVIFWAGTGSDAVEGTARSDQVADWTAGAFPGTSHDNDVQFESDSSFQFEFSATRYTRDFQRAYDLSTNISHATEWFSWFSVPFDGYTTALGGTNLYFLASPDDYSGMDIGGVAKQDKFAYIGGQTTNLLPFNTFVLDTIFDDSANPVPDMPTAPDGETYIYNFKTGSGEGDVFGTVRDWAIVEWDFEYK